LLLSKKTCEKRKKEKRTKRKKSRQAHFSSVSKSQSVQKKKTKEIASLLGAQTHGG